MESESGWKNLCRLRRWDVSPQGRVVEDPQTSSDTPTRRSSFLLLRSETVQPLRLCTRTTAAAPGKGGGEPSHRQVTPSIAFGVGAEPICRRWIAGTYFQCGGSQCFSVFLAFECLPIGLHPP